MPVIKSNAMPLRLPPFDENGVTKGRSGTAVTRVNPAGVLVPMLQISVKEEPGRKCDTDGAPFSRMGIYIQAWEIVSKGIPVPDVGFPYLYPLDIYGGVGTAVELMDSAFWNVFAPVFSNNAWDESTGLVLQFGGQLMDTVYISMCDPATLPPGLDIRPNFVIIADRQDGVVNGTSSTGSRSTIRGQNYF